MRSKREKRIIRRRLVSTITALLLIGGAIYIFFVFKPPTALDIKNYYDAPIEEDDGTRYG